jgi:hypothetical protein
MKTFQTSICLVVLLLLLGGCDPPEIQPLPDPDPLADLVLDELVDKQSYAEGMSVDCRYFKGAVTKSITLNGQKISPPGTEDLRSPGYYHLEVFTGESSTQAAGMIRLVVLDPERGQAEWGLPPWTPQGVEFSSIGTQQVRTLFPGTIPTGATFPLIVLIDGELTHSLDNFEGEAGGNSFLIKRGVGSTWISGDKSFPVSLNIGMRSFAMETEYFTDPPLELGGTMNASRTFPAGSYVHITEDLFIPSGISLSFGEASFIAVDPQVNIHLEGSLLFEGKEGSLITLTCSDPARYWGGVIGSGPENHLEASHAIFSRSGYHSGPAYDWGHAHRQALFFSENGNLSVDHCYMIDHIGQVFYTESASLDLGYSLIQRAKTGGQLNGSRVQIEHSIFTDFPDDSKDYRDQDNDALYLIECVADISYSVFMYAKDDGLDSGGGSVGGQVRVRHTRFESIFHEGAALSGGNSQGKYQQFIHCLFQDCGQGLELGFSSSQHQVEVDSCSFIKNGIGIRYGDCYVYPNNGYLSVSNSESLENISYDVWNMDREDWIADTSHMEFRNVWVTTPNPMYPQLQIRE